MSNRLLPGRRIQPSARFEEFTYVAGMFEADATVARRIVSDPSEAVEVETDLGPATGEAAATAAATDGESTS